MGIRNRLVTAVVAAVGTIALAVAAAPSAQAVASFGPRVTVSTTCLRAHTATSSTGVTRGAFDCPVSGTRRIYVFSGTGTSWSRASTGVNGRVVAFADDGTYSFVMYSPVSPDGRIFLLRRNHSTGASTTVTLASTLVDVAALAGSLVVSGGRYWAAWSISNGGFNRTYTRQNLVSSLPATFPFVGGLNPSVARVGTSSMVMLVQGSNLSSGNTIVKYVPRAGGTWGSTTIRSFGAFEPQVVRSNGVTYMAWTELSTFPEQKIVYQDDASGAFVRRSFTATASSGTDVRLFLTGGKPTIVWTGHGAGAPGQTYLRVAQRSAGSWTSLVVGDGANNAWLADAAGWAGKTIVVMGKANGLEGFSSRRQP